MLSLAQEPTSAPPKKEISGYFQVGAGHDQNVTSGPDAQYLMIPGYSETSPTDWSDSDQEDVQFLQLAAGTGFNYQLSKQNKLFGGVDLSQNFHNKRHDLEEGFGSANLGFSRQTGNSVYSLRGVAQAYQLDDDLYQTYWSGQFYWQYKLRQNQWLNSYVNHVDYSYPDSPEYETTRTVLGLISMHGFGNKNKKASFYYGLYGGKEIEKDSDMAYLANDIWGGLLGVNYQIHPLVKLMGSVYYENRQHDGIDDLYFSLREDNQWTVNVAFDYPISKNLHLIPQFSYISNSSNLEVYDYQRSVFFLALRWNFKKEML
jgi:hypothetical protein